MFFYVQYAGTRGRHDIVEFAKVPYKKGRTFLAEMFKTRIGHWLPATSLIGGINDLANEFFQQFESSNAHLRIELVDIARDEKANTHHL
jgi:hypothetical protein